MTAPPGPDPGSLGVALLQIFGTGVAFSVRSLPSRARALEFEGGRRCASECLLQLGWVGGMLGIERDGSPGWPSGYVGSISHSGGWVVAVAARRELLAGLGVDCQMRRPIPAERLTACFAPEEVRWVESWEPCVQDHRAAALFAMKESAQKCVRSALGVLPPPERVVIQPDWPSGEFQAGLGEERGTGRVPCRLQGAFAEVGGLLLTGAVLSATPGTAPLPGTP